MTLDRTPYWDLIPFIFVSCIIALYLLIRWVLDVVDVWWTYHRKWKAVQPYYGSFYDARYLSTKARPNIRLK